MAASTPRSRNKARPPQSDGRGPSSWSLLLVAFGSSTRHLNRRDHCRPGRHPPRAPRRPNTALLTLVASPGPHGSPPPSHSGGGNAVVVSSCKSSELLPHREHSLPKSLSQNQPGRAFDVLSLGRGAPRPGLAGCSPHGHRSARVTTIPGTSPFKAAWDQSPRQSCEGFTCEMLPGRDPREVTL